MIFDFLSVMAYNMLGVLALVFPNATVGETALLSGQLTSFKNAIGSANLLFPVSDFFTILSAIIVIESAVFSWNFMRWLITIISAGFVKAK